MGPIVKGPDGCWRNWSKLTVYSGIRQLQPSTEIKGNIWGAHLDLNNGGKMSEQSHTQIKPYGSHLTWVLFQTFIVDCSESLSVKTLCYEINNTRFKFMFVLDSTADQRTMMNNLLHFHYASELYDGHFLVIFILFLFYSDNSGTSKSSNPAVCQALKVFQFQSCPKHHLKQAFSKV